jgi:hypothetical protein
MTLVSLGLRSSSFVRQDSQLCLLVDAFCWKLTIHLAGQYWVLHLFLFGLQDILVVEFGVRTDSTARWDAS